MRLLTKILIASTALLLLAACTSTPTVPTEELHTVTSQDHVKGASAPEITLIEYGDFECPACGVVSPFLTRAADEYGDRVQFVYRHFPLVQIHANALPAAYASEAAANQGKFWEMHDMLFAGQNDWSRVTDVATIFTGYAEELGLDLEQFQADMESEAVQDRVQRDYDIAGQLKLNSTPTLMIDGEKMPTPRTYEQFEAILDGALRDATS